MTLNCRKPNKNFLRAALQAAQDGIRAGGGGKTSMDVQSENVATDFISLLSARVLVLSASTFSFWSAFLNPVAIEAHIPFFGVMSDDEKVSAVRSTRWQELSQQPRVYIHRLKAGFAPIRTEEQLRQ